MVDFGSSGQPFSVLHDELVVAGEQVPATPGEVERVGHQRHAVVQVNLGLDVFERKTW